jgi:hypothetical protein
MHDVILLLAAITINDATPSAAQIEACLPDALRYCIRANPDRSGTATLDRAGIERCMRAHKDQLTRACREAFK